MTNVQASEFRSELLENPSNTGCSTNQIRPRSLYTLTDDPFVYQVDLSYIILNNL